MHSPTKNRRLEARLLMVGHKSNQQNGIQHDMAVKTFLNFISRCNDITKKDVLD